MEILKKVCSVLYDIIMSSVHVISCHIDRINYPNMSLKHDHAYILSSHLFCLIMGDTCILLYACVKVKPY